MNTLTVQVKPQFVRLTELTERFPDGKEHRLHEVQKRLKLDFDRLPEFTIVTAPTGTGKSYAFPFPVLESKKRGFSSLAEIDDTGLRTRGCIVLPTNALIDELTENFSKTYPNLRVNRLTGAELDARNVKGFNRWKTALNICRESDLVITNPDIINFAMHGGYHFYRQKSQKEPNPKTGGDEFPNFLGLFNYLVFDEYHLYDEAQIANILALVKMREFFLPHQKLRYLFVSATPETGLKKILEAEEYAFEEIIETITDDPTDARPIHGKLEVEFVQSNDLQKVVLEKTDELLAEFRAGKRSLVVADQLRDVHVLVENWRAAHWEILVFESSGYQPKGDENLKTELETAHLIVATNKAEVGVNYGVEYCIMQTGRYFRNFVQRFGRTSRGDLSGKVVVLVRDFSTFNRLKSAFAGASKLGYYDFLERIRPHFQEKKFYDETVPWLLGEYVWCIENNISVCQEFNTGMFLRRRMKEEDFFRGKTFARYKLMDEVDDLIWEGMKYALPKEEIKKWNWRAAMSKLKVSPTIEVWANWWQVYLETYFAFRDGSKVVPIYDEHLKREVDYSLEWILQHKELLEIKKDANGKPIRYIVGRLKTRDKDLQYETGTLPPGIAENRFFQWREQFELEKVFARAVERLIQKHAKGVGWISEWQLRLCEKLRLLGKTFSCKRLLVENIESDNFF